MKRLLFLLTSALLLTACGNDEPKKDEPVVEDDAPVVEEVETDKQDEAEKDEPVTEEDSSWDDVKEVDKIIGKSDKDFSEVTKSKPNDVRNDNTGNWRILKISENIDIEEYALSYADMHMKDDEVHFIVNFNYHTTTVINKMDGLLYVDIKEYEKKEEHDAKVLGSGMVLKSYVIYPDGDIQELEIE